MDELDELARARQERAGTPRQTAGNDRFDWRRWVIMGCAIVSCAAIAAAYLLTREGSSAPETNSSAVATPAQVAAASQPARSGASSQPAPIAKAGTRPARSPSRPALIDVSDPAKAIDIYHLKYGGGDMLQIKARNISRQSVFVRSVELFAEGGDSKPLDNIGFWLPAGEVVVAEREIPQLSRRLGPDGKITAAIRAAEFRDAPPDDVDQRGR